jgi:protein-L-isoaspartate(D-aspartate) O-methyltransferase
MDRQRRRMIRRHLAARGVDDRRVLAAMAAVPRETFVLPALQTCAYADRPLPIGNGQTISQPYIVALMTMACGMTRHSRVLEIGTGSGYQTAVLSKIARHVWSVERVPDLSAAAVARLAQLGIRNVSCIQGDGAVGYPGAAPFDAILVTAASPAVLPALQDQLAPGGRLVIPVGERALQDLVVVQRADHGLERRSIGACRFVPLVSPHAFHG